MLVPLDLPPGLYKNGTARQSQGRFYEAELWRWHEGTQRPIGGWQEKSTSTVSGAARALITWLDNQNATWAGVGTHTGLYAMTRSGVVHDITPAGIAAGNENAIAGGGYGTGTYGTAVYGVPRPDATSIIPASVWSLDTWGEYLVGAFDATIYEWQLDVNAEAVAVSGAPSAEALLVTEERIMFALGSDGDPRAVDWSDAEDNTDWTPTATNLAGGKRLQTNGQLLTGRKVSGGGLLFTDVDVHRYQYVGLPQVYQFERLASGCGAISKGAVVAIDNRAFWMGLNGFWTYNGSVGPLDCEVADIFANLNQTQISKVAHLHNSSFGEIWWFYPSATSIECDRVVIYNYREGHWNDMTLTRLCGTDRGVFARPLLVDADGQVWEHEIGQIRDGRQPYALSGPVEIGSGDRTMAVEAIIPDEQTLGDVAVSFSVKDWPMDTAVDVGPFDAASLTQCWFSGRSVAAKFTADADKDFRLGSYRFDVKPGSKR